MNSHPASARVSPRAFTIIFAGIIICWLVLAWVHLYFFGYPAVDTWCYAGPAITARAPLALTMPFLGTFEGGDRAWGLHWPGGPLLTSLIFPFLPHSPAVFVSIYLSFWLLLGLAVVALTRRLTGSPWLALCGLLFVFGDRICFSVTWMERYELLDGAIAITAILALCDKKTWHPGLRSVVIAGAFFLFPLLQPVISGMGLAWLCCIGVRTWALKQSWKDFCIAALATLLGWAAFLGYYLSRPWLLAIFLSHARVNIAVARQTAPPGIRMFVWRILHVGGLPYTAPMVYLAALGGVIYLLFAFWQERGTWREFIAREDLALFAAVALVCNIFLAQFNYTDAYWAPAWPFAVALACLTAWRLHCWAPGQRLLWWGALIAVMVIHCSYLPARTYLWYKQKFVNMRTELRNFAASLPQGGQLFVPEVLWETFADGHRAIYMTAVPADVGEAVQKKYAAYIEPQIHSGDVFVTDDSQAHPTLIDPHQPGWKEIGKCSDLYSGAEKHGFALTAYQKE